MGRPASSDRKEVVTLRLRQSVISAYKANGEDWRARMEAAIEAGLEKPEKAPKPAAPAKPAKAASGQKTGPAVDAMAKLAAVPLGPAPFTPRLKKR